MNPNLAPAAGAAISMALGPAALVATAVPPAAVGIAVVAVGIGLGAAIFALASGSK